MAVVSVTAAHLNDGPYRIPTITAPPKAVFSVNTEKTICLIICETYPTDFVIIGVHYRHLVLASEA